MEKIKRFVVGIPKKVYMIGFFLFLLIDAIGFKFDQILKSVEVFSIADAYNSLIAVFPTIQQVAQQYRYVFLVLTVVFFVLWIYRPKLILVKHVSFSKDIAAVQPNILRRYFVKEIEINQCDEMKKNDTIVNAITIQDKTAEDIQNKRKTSSLCYYGIAHTPLIFRFGFKMGDQNNIMLLHKIRANDSLFEELTHESGYSSIQPNERNISIKSNELLVSISTSLPISVNDLQSLRPENKHILSFVCNNISFDSITSYKLAENFRNTVMITIRDCVKKYGIRKIHLVISSSVAFTFFLGQAFSAQHEPITIVYHFQNGTYPWGININEPANNALVINNEM